MSDEKVTKDYKIKVHSAILKCCKVTPTPSLILGHAEGLRKMSSRYPFYRTTMKTFAIPAGQYSFAVQDMFQGNVPTKMVVAMVTSAAFNGHIQKNPYDFRSFGLNSIGIYLDDEPVRGKPLQLNFTDAKGINYIEAYHSLFEGMDKDGEDTGLDISRDDFKGGYALFVFNLQYSTPDTFPLLRGVT
jgi:hypothetical protein